MIEIDNIYNMDCLEGMRQMESESVDLTVTSPPYDNLRSYKGYCFDFENIAKELYRVTKDGGVVVWERRCNNRRQRNGYVFPSSSLLQGDWFQSARYDDISEIQPHTAEPQPL